MAHNRAAQDCRQGRCHATSSTKSSTQNATSWEKDAHTVIWWGLLFKFKSRYDTMN